jgi:precorrin-2 dehydrogenase / sirohydrochlorin ferrochelatase
VSTPRPLPVGLRLAGRRCVVVGAGPMGRRRVGRLLDAGAEVVLVAPDAAAELVALADDGAIDWRRRAFGPDDVAGAALVVAATGVPDVDEAVARAARAAGALVNRADDAASGDVDLAAEVRRGPLSIAVSTGGEAPAVSAWAAALVDATLDDSLGLDAAGVALLVEVVAEVRAERAAAGPSAAATPGAPPVTGGLPDWRSALDRTMLDLISRGRKAQAKERLQACLSSS